MGKKVLITGATGMIGGLVLQYCLESHDVSEVISLVRRPPGKSHKKLREVIIEDFQNLEEDAEYLESIDVVYYCLGVYTGAVSRESFREITVDYPDTLANVLIKKNSELSFCLLSGAGADRSEKSRMMFAKDKGVIENRLAKKGFRAFYAFRPGYIYPVTPRSEPSISYKLMRVLYPVIKLFGKNASIRSTDLALTMFYVGLEGCNLEILENADIFKVFKEKATIYSGE